MAETYKLICDQCRVRVWIGQDHAGNRDKFYLYGGGWAVPDGPNRVFSPAAKFLLDHELHPLRFVSANSMPFEAWDYVELNEDDPQLAPAPKPPA
jgi:hypothetical protein